MTDHPTPVHIRIKIAEALTADFDRTKDSDVPTIPARALRIVNDAINEAIREATQ